MARRRRKRRDEVPAERWTSSPAVVDTPMSEWKPEEVEAHLDYYGGLHRELIASGELVESRGPDRARPGQDRDVGRRAPRRSSPTGRSRSSRSGSPATRSSTSTPRRGRSRSRRRLSAVPGPGGVPIQQPIQVRRMMDDGAVRRRPRWTRSSRPPGRRRAERDPCAADVEDLLRELAPQVLGALTRRSGDFDAAEDAVQEALIAAADHWPREGVPDAAAGWLLADRDAGGSSTSAAASASRADREVPRRCDPAAAGRRTATEDDTLAVLFLCCHPSLTPASAIALTLRAVGGLTHRARSPARSSCPRRRWPSGSRRAKRTIESSGVPFRLPTPDGAAGATAERAARPVPDVQRGLRDQRRAGPAARRPLGRGDPAGPAWCTRPLPDDPEVAGLLALMLLHRRPSARPHRPPAASWSRSPTRTARRWDRARDRRGHRAARRRDRPRARSASTSCRRRSRRSTTGRPAPTATDWPQILALYELLERMTGNPVVTLNRAVAAAMATARRPAWRSWTGSTTGSPPPRPAPRAPPRAGRRPRAAPSPTTATAARPRDEPPRARLPRAQVARLADVK